MIETHLAVGGAVAFWTLAEWTDRQRLRYGLEKLGLEAFVPEERLPAAALRDALTEVLGGPRTLIRPLAQKDGFAVVREDRGTVENRYATDLVARVMEGPRPHLSFEPYGPKAVAVEASFQTQLGRVSGAQLSSALVKVVESLSGTRLRPTGAIYWIPGPRLADWADVGQAVEAAADGAPSAVYLIKHRLDGEAVRAIRDAVVAEVSAEATRIREDVAAGDLGGRALETRKQQAADLRSKVLLYEDLLSVGLDGLHRAVDDADQAAATASLLLSAQVPHVVRAAG
jgi:hypothetical protein